MIGGLGSQVSVFKRGRGGEFLLNKDILNVRELSTTYLYDKYRGK